MRDITGRLQFPQRSLLSRTLTPKTITIISDKLITLKSFPFTQLEQQKLNLDFGQKKVVSVIVTLTTKIKV
ncbi:hypothetical protein [Okeania sp. KiyG1]|uniref:hypothetical protein n=1 Tax=Okeania sp. KiyG1 TaxID=2720165 RepID=UPI001920B8E9|nr:hypothetical protein [Okeania sp. KiyG1]GFZ92466.1 hypothetical protein CYANOKiyG1_03120 [Okeania sp. KiyG1]